MTREEAIKIINCYDILLAIMVIAVVMTLKWSYVALKEERRKMKGEKEDAGSNVERDI